MSEQTLTAFMVQELFWEYNDEHYYRPHGFAGPDDDGPKLEVFLDRARAEAHCRALEQQRRDALGAPCGYGEPGEWADFSSLGPGAIVERFRAVGLDADEAKLQELCYRVMGGGLTPDQQRVLWEVCDLVRFYQVVAVEVPFEPGPG